MRFYDLSVCTLLLVHVHGFLQSQNGNLLVVEGMFDVTSYRGRTSLYVRGGALINILMQMVSCTQFYANDITIASISERTGSFVAKC